MQRRPFAPKKHETTDASDLFRARLDQIINMKHERVQLASKLDLEWLDGEIAPLYSDKGRPAIKTPLGQKNRNCRKEVSFHSRRGLGGSRRGRIFWEIDRESAGERAISF